MLLSDLLGNTSKCWLLASVENSHPATHCR